MRELETAGKRQGWWDSGGILVALSGGGDSMALLSLLRMAYGGRVEAAHLEHGFRGEESMADAGFVSDFCRQSGITCHIRHADVASLRRKRESKETAGRRIRYEFLHETSERRNLPFIATAHNAGDTVETVAHNFFRGTGIAGLSGIPQRRGQIVRPLAACSRDDLRLFLSTRGIPWREDATNNENRYTRNKIRNELLPWVKSNLNEGADRAILGLAGECARLSPRLLAEARSMLRLVSRGHSFALAAWDTAAARRMSETQLSGALRFQAELLDLPVIDRKRLGLLAGMIRYNRRGRFQWSGETEVCCGGPMIGWINRRLLEPPPEERIVLEDGASRSFSWGPWTIELEMRQSARRFRTPGPRAELPSRDPSGVIELTAAEKFAGRNILDFRAKIPWWSAAGTPVLLFRGKNSHAVWSPGVRRDVREKDVYVIIARVFAGKEQIVEAETWREFI